MIEFFWKQLVRLRNPSCTIKSGLIGRNVRLGRKNHIGYGSQITADSIGDYTYINNYCLIDRNVKSIGKYCSIAYNCRIGLGSHPTDWVSTHPFAYAKKYGFRSNNIPFSDKAELKTIIGNDVWIGANSTILAGVIIGDGAIIGAHSLVTKDVAPYSVVIGSPARHIKFRISEDNIARLMEIKWWNWEYKKIAANIELFQNPEKLIEK